MNEFFIIAIITVMFIVPGMIAISLAIEHRKETRK